MMGIWDCSLGCSEKKIEETKLHLVAVRRKEEKKAELDYTEKNKGE